MREWENREEIAAVVHMHVDCVLSLVKQEGQEKGEVLKKSL